MACVASSTRRGRRAPLFASPLLARFIRHARPLVSHARRRTCACAANSGPLPASVAVTRDVRSGATVYLLGCVHGSRVSAEDVKSVIRRTGPDVVVLELCDARLRALRKDMARQRGEAVSGGDIPHTYYGGSRRGPVESFRASVQRFGGPGPALLASVLTAVYKLQMLVGIDPGTEFKTAITLSERAVWRTVCGDAPATTTVRNLFGIFMSPGRAVSKALGTVAAICERLVHPPKSGINMFSVLFEARRMRELAKVMIPLLAIVTALSAASSTGATGLEQGFVIGTGFRATAEMSVVIGVVRAVLDMVLSSYLIICALEFFRVLIAERDVVLSQSIRKAAEELGSAANGGSVVAIVGLMHVNGVVRYLESENDDF